MIALRKSARRILSALDARPPVRSGRAALITGALLVFASPGDGIAEDRGPTTEQLTERTRGFAEFWETFVEKAAGLRFRFEEDLISTGEYDGAQTAWIRTGVSVKGGVPITDSLSVGLSPSFAWERLFIDGSDDLVISQEGRDAHITNFFDSSLRIGANYRLNDEWGGEFVTGFSARQESGADYGKAAQSGGSLALTYQRGEWLRLRLGVGAGADISDGQLRFSPVYRIQIKPHPDWTIESSGIGGSIEWKATQRTALTIGGRLEGTQYRLARRGRPPTGSGHATLQRRQARIDLDLVHHFHHKFQLRGGVGIVLNEELSILDSDGVDLDTRRTRDPSAVLRLGIDFRL